MKIINKQDILLIFTLSLFIFPCVSGSDLHITCDFDLENIDLILPQLPQKCINLYYDRQNNASLYQMYTDEAKRFGVFVAKLDKYERRGSAEVLLTEYPFDVELRKQIYTKVDLGLCVTTANDTAEHYLECMKQKRLEITNLIPNALVS